METIDNLRNSIIDQLLSISNPEYLMALNQLVKSSAVKNNVVQLSETQLLMLQFSESDIKNGRLITQAELDKNDVEWLSEQ